MNVTLLLDIEGFQTVLCCYMSNLKECDNRCVQKKKKKIGAHLTQVFSSTSSIFPQSDLFTSALSYFTPPLHLCSISSIFHICAFILLSPANDQNLI